MGRAWVSGTCGNVGERVPGMGERFEIKVESGRNIGMGSERDKKGGNGNLGFIIGGRSIALPVHTQVMGVRHCVPAWLRRGLPTHRLLILPGSLLRSALSPWV